MLPSNATTNRDRWESIPSFAKLTPPEMRRKLPGTETEERRKRGSKTVSGRKGRKAMTGTPRASRERRKRKSPLGWKASPVFAASGRLGSPGPRTGPRPPAVDKKRTRRSSETPLTMRTNDWFSDCTDAVTKPKTHVGLFPSLGLGSSARKRQKLSRSESLGSRRKESRNKIMEDVVGVLKQFSTVIKSSILRVEEKQKKYCDMLDKRLTTLEQQMESQTKMMTTFKDQIVEKLDRIDRRSRRKEKIDTELINDSLCKAVKTRQVVRVKALLPLSNPENLRIKTSYVEGENEYTPLLMYAVSNNAYKIAKVLLEDSSGRINVNEKVQLAYDCETALLQAITNGSKRLVDLLLQYGADPNLANNGGVTPLHRACYRGYTRILTKLTRGVPMGSKGEPYLFERRQKEKLYRLLVSMDWSPLAATPYIWEIIVDMVIMPVDIFAVDKKGERAIDFARNKNHHSCEKLMHCAMEGLPAHCVANLMSDSDSSGT